MASSAASSAIGVTFGCSETTSEALLGRPSISTAATPAYRTPAAALSSASTALSTAQSRHADGPSVANNSSATSASCSASAASSPRTLSAWKAGGTSSRTSTPVPAASSVGAKVCCPEASSASGAANGGRSRAADGSALTGSWNAAADRLPASPRTGPAP